jgi:hypothetical protein
VAVSYTRFTLRHAQILADDKCLLVIDDTHGNITIYCDQMSSMDAAVRQKRFRKSLNRDKIGQDFLLAYDETKRMLAVCGSHKVWILIQLSIILLKGLGM